MKISKHNLTAFSAKCKTQARFHIWRMAWHDIKITFSFVVQCSGMVAFVAAEQQIEIGLKTHHNSTTAPTPATYRLIVMIMETIKMPDCAIVAFNLLWCGKDSLFCDVIRPWFPLVSFRKKHLSPVFTLFLRQLKWRNKIANYNFPIITFRSSRQKEKSLWAGVMPQWQL